MTGMNKRTFVAIVIIGIMAAGILGAAVGNSLEKPDLKEDTDWDRVKRFQDRDLKTYLIVKTAVSFINVVIAILLITLYVGIYREVRSEFTLGLIIVMSTMLMYAITSNPMTQIALGYPSFGLGPFLLIPDIFATVAMSILLYISLK
jgi:hypothetical protein